MVSNNHRFHGLGSLRPVYRHGKTVRGPQISLRYQINHRRGSYRVALVVSKKVSKLAVKRNRIRRRVYEIVRLQENKITGPYEFIITIFSDQLLDWPNHKLTKEITDLLQKAGIIDS